MFRVRHRQDIEALSAILLEPMLRRTVLLALGLFACGTDVASSTTESASQSATLGDLVVVDQVAVYQSVKVTLVDAEAILGRPNAPVIPLRPAYVRVHVRTGPPLTKVPALTAVLRVTAPGRPDVVLEDGPKNIVALDDANVGSTFNFELSATQVQPGAAFSVELVDGSGGTPGVYLFPQTGTVPMNVGTLAPTLKVRFVPVRYQADGSSRISPLDASTLAAYRDALYKVYPAANVEVTVNPELAWPTVVSADGDGWDSLLGAIIETRQDDGAADDVYYVGIFNPAATEREYCRNGCVLGVAPAAYRGEVDLRVAMVVGYPGERAHGTLAQEIAHAMGRYHAPCGRPSALDPKYPYPGGAIGTWGYDVVERRLVDPQQEVFDFMSYCSPVWVSDYTFSALYENMLDVERTKRPITLAQKKIKSYRVDADGTMRPGPSMRIDLDAAAPEETIAVENLARRPLRAVHGRFRPTSGIGGGYLLADEEIPVGTRVLLPGK